ncbi:MAG: penicillin-binding protein activator, partial [Candidatus Binatia bacterium]
HQEDKPTLERIRKVIFEELSPGDVLRVLDGSPGPQVSGYAHYRLAQIYSQAQDYPAARKHLEKLLRFSPRHDYRKQANLLLEQIEDQEKLLIQAERSRLGCLLPLSGKNAALGRKLLRGIQLAFLNDGYLEGGLPIKLIVKDSQGEPQQAMAALEQLGVQEKVIAILGPALPEVLSEILPLAQRYHIPLFSSSVQVSSVFPNARPYAFSNALNSRDEGEAISHFAVRSLGVETFAVLYPTSPYGIALKEIFLKEVERAGGRVMAVEAYDPEARDLSAQVQRLKEVLDNVGFQALFLPDFFPRLGIVLPQLDFYELRVPLLGSHGWHSPLLREMGNGYAEGAIFAAGFFLASPDPTVKQFVQDFRLTFGEEPNYLAAQGYDAAQIVFQALKKGIKSRDQLRDQLSNVRDFPGISGLTSIGPTGQANKKLFLLTVSGGKVLQLLDDTK